MLDKEVYTKFRESSQDPMTLCHKIYNLESKVGKLPYKEFITAFSTWLALIGKPDVLRESQVLKNYFDKKFGVLK